MSRASLSRIAIAVGATVLLLASTHDSIVSAQTRDRKPPTQPTDLRVTSITSYSVSLSWTPSTDNSGKFSYVICCANVSRQTVDQAATSVVYTAGLEAGRSFTLQVYAVDAAGNYSKASNAVSFTLPADSIPPTQPTLAATDVGPTHVSLAWSSTDDGPHVWYWVFMDGNSVIQGTANRSGTVIPLQPSSTHTFSVRARDFGGNWSAFSQAITVTTKASNPDDITPPTPPTNVTGGGVGDGSGEIHLTWNQSTDDLDPQWVIQYNVYVNGLLSDVVIGSGHSIVYGNLGPNMLAVEAVDTAGNTSARVTITVEGS